MSLKHDIQELTDNQIIDQETAERIAQYYQSKKKTINISAIICIVAAIFIGSGVISIIAFNWDDLPTFLRLLIALVPLSASSYGCYYALKNKSDQKTWTEPMAILQWLGYSASFALVNQIYQIQMDTDSFICFWLFFSLPFIFIMRSAALSIILIVFTSYFFWDSTHEFMSMNCLTTVAAVVADIAFIYYYYFKQNEDFLMRLRVNLTPFIVISLAFKIRDILGICLTGEEVTCLILLYSSTLYLLHTWILDSKKINSKGRLFKISFYLMFFPCILFLSTEKFFNTTDINLLRIVTIMLPIILSAGLKIKLKKQIQWQEWIGLPTAVCLMLIHDNVIIFSLISLAIIVYCIYESSKDLDLLKMNCGLISLFAWVFIVLVRFNLNFYIFGIILILMGIALFLMNKFLIDKKKSHELTETK
ncbi:MAG: DUF2157 domain-containing protein [Paludibacteraceae bacterium]|nr:DUF2157 domain-containing protein [Paludibacteraceae bacterium]